MKLVLILLGTLAALTFTFAGMPMLFVGSWPQSVAPAPEVAHIVTAYNAGKSTQLTGSARKLAVDQCMANFQKQRKPGVVDEDNTAALRQSLETAADDRCKCMVKTIEANSTTVEFALAMSMDFIVVKDLDAAEYSIGNPENFKGVESIASAAGVAEQAFDTAGLRAIEAVLAASGKCIK